MRHDVLADVFSIIKGMENIGRKEAKVPATALAENVLKIMHENNYIGNYPQKDRYRTVQLMGRINDCNVIRPRFSVKKDDFIRWEKRFLPAVGTGILILTTTKGIMDHHAARKEGVGGQLLGFVY